MDIKVLKTFNVLDLEKINKMEEGWQNRRQGSPSRNIKTISKQLRDHISQDNNVRDWFCPIQIN